MTIELNSLLATLKGADAEMIEKLSEFREYETGHVFYEPGDHVDFAYFPLGDSVASFLVVVDKGNAIETAMVGKEGAIGGIVSHGRLPAYARACVLHGGQFIRISSKNLEEAKDESIVMRHLFARYADCLVAQIFQSVACNAAHKLEARAAKWLCASVERTGMKHINMTQEQFASILGVGRSYASRLLQKFKAENLVITKRKSIIVTDYAALRSKSCGCNMQIHMHFDTVLSGVYPKIDDAR